MERFTNAALFGISFVAIFGMGALHPYLQIIQGKLDAQYIAEVTADMKRQGRL